MGRENYLKACYLLLKVTVTIFKFELINGAFLVTHLKMLIGIGIGLPDD